MTWDENSSGPTNRILTVAVGAPVQQDFVPTRNVSHYTLLRTICDVLRLPAPGRAASEPPITDIWMPSGTAAQ